ncbi:phosphoserine phosphatase SerB [Neisseria lactamica ATCC 23970]|nr:phosphoserine phosphatase SerB [Neisseria lactamica ATCC 23970]
MPQALVLQFPSAEALPSDFLSRLPEPDCADEKRMRFIVEEGFF